MARLVANREFNMTDFMANADLAGLFASGDVVTRTSTTFKLRDAYGGITEELTLTGSFGGYNGAGHPTTGTITGGTYSISNGTSFRFSGVSMSVADFTAYVEANDLQGLFADLLDGNDMITGSSGNDVLLAFSGNDTLNGGAGNDTLNGGTGIDTATYANAGAAVTLSLATTAAQTSGGSGTERLVSIENLTGSAYADTLTGNGGRNVLTGGAGADTLNGGGGGDALNGGTGNDTLNGGGGNDILTGNGGGDTMVGGAGNDTYYWSGADTITELAGGGTDTVHVVTSFALEDGSHVENVILDGTDDCPLWGNSSRNVLHGNSNVNVIDGQEGNDDIYGNGGDDWLMGYHGNDLASGGDGDDILWGEGGNDTLVGGTGSDELWGDVGADIFRFDTALNASTNVDEITDFTSSDDTIQLDQTIFAAIGTLGTLSAGAFRAGTAAADASDRIIYDSATGNIYYDADGSGPGNQVLFATVAAGSVVTYADFMVIA